MQNGQPESPPDSYPRCLAMLPISFLSEQGDPLVGLCGLPAGAGDYQNLFTSGIWVYVLHSYRMLVCEKLGEEVAATVWSHQRDMFDSAEPGAGRAMETAFRLIDAGLETGRAGLNGPEDAVPLAPERMVAMALLMGMPESPDYVSAIGTCHDRIGMTQTELEDRFARCLRRARKELLAACAGLFGNHCSDA